jgi:diguanylate cyclase (GGDEF)-like protein
MALACAAARMIADWPLLKQHPFILYWNTFVIFGFFLITALMLARLNTAFRREQQFSRVDFLTGVANPRSFHAFAQREAARANRYRHPLTIAYMDIDNFKEINDRFGHATGDALLVWVARTVESNLRRSDCVARIGGDEFAILLPETGSQAAEAVLNKLRRVLLENMEKNRWPVTFSIGAVTYNTEPASLDEMIRRADELMYSVKTTGKNNIAQMVVG